MKPKPFPFQQECVREIEFFEGRALVALDPGLGKTGISYAYLKQHPECLPAVVVCPASVKYQWEREAMRWAGMRATVLEGCSPSPKKLKLNKPKLVIINYDILFPRRSKRTKKMGASWVDWIKKLKPKMVIIDESQCIAGQSKRSKATKKLCNGVPYVLALSGTPLVNRPIELYPTLEILRPDIFNSRWSFAQEYCDPHLTPWGWEYKGCTKPKELHRLLESTVMIRRKKMEVMKDMPEKMREVIPVPLSNRAEYETAKRDFISWLRQQDPSAAKRAARAQNMTQTGYLLRLAAQLKIPSVVDWIKNFLAETDEKLVVGAVHRNIIKTLREQVNQKSVVIDGSVTGTHRKATIDQFRNNKDVRICYGNIKAMGTGVDGLQIAHNIAIVELGWTPGGMIQLEDRCHRIGTKDTVFSFWLISFNTIEEQLAKILQSKQKNISNVLDGGSMRSDISVFDQLMRELQKEAFK